MKRLFKPAQYLAMLLTAVMVFTTAACSDAQIRGNIKIAVEDAHSVARAVAFQLPASDPRIAQVQAFSDALDRFDAAFPAAKTTETKQAAMLLFSDAVTAFDAAVLPLLPLGGVLAIGIVAADTALRILATQLNDLLAKALVKMKPNLTGPQLAAVQRFQGTVDHYLAERPAG